MLAVRLVFWAHSVNEKPETSKTLNHLPGSTKLGYDPKVPFFTRMLHSELLIGPSHQMGNPKVGYQPLKGRETGSLVLGSLLGVVGEVRFWIPVLRVGQVISSPWASTFSSVKWAYITFALMPAEASHEIMSVQKTGWAPPHPTPHKTTCPNYLLKECLDSGEEFPGSPRDWTYTCPEARIKGHPHYDALEWRRQMGVGSRWSVRRQPQVQGFPLSQRGIQITFPDKSMASPSRESPRKLPRTWSWTGQRWSRTSQMGTLGISSSFHQVPRAGAAG